MDPTKVAFAVLSIATGSLDVSGVAFTAGLCWNER
jgi:hypothetical protein